MCSGSEEGSYLSPMPPNRKQPHPTFVSASVLGQAILLPIAVTPKQPILSNTLRPTTVNPCEDQVLDEPASGHDLDCTGLHNPTPRALNPKPTPPCLQPHPTFVSASVLGQAILLPILGLFMGILGTPRPAPDRLAQS